MADLNIFGTTFSNASGFKIEDTEGNLRTFKEDDHLIEDAMVTKSLTEYSNDRITRTGNSAFQGSTNLRSISLPNVEELGKFTFNDCSSLTVVVFPKVKNILQCAFQRNTSITAADFGNAQTIPESSTFNGCTKLTTLILRGDSVCTLGDITSFLNTPFRNSTAATLYVKESLIDSYKEAAKWSSFLGSNNNEVLPIEGSYYETHYADGTEIL